MIQILLETFVPLISLFIFVLGTGFFSTLLVLQMTLLQEPPLYVGALTGFFYAGLILGTFRIERLIIRVGHIRAYAAFSSMLATIAILHGLYYNPYAWMALRLLAGVASAGLYVVIESWLLCKSTKINRGQVLALYMIVFYAGQSLGQFMLNLAEPGELTLFCITSMLCSLSIIPLTMAKVHTPIFEEPSKLGWKNLLNQSASGLLGCLSSGMLMGTIYGLMPSYFTHLFHHKSDVANFMFVIIFGGMLLQYPVGKLSDMIERRLVLIFIALGTIVLSSLSLIFQFNPNVLFVIMGLFGGLTFTMYPISITHACDALKPEDIVAGTQSLLLAYSIGAMVGPFAAALFISQIGNSGVLVFFIFVCVVMIPLLIARKAKNPDVTQDEPFISLTQTTSIIAEIDPRGEDR